MNAEELIFKEQRERLGLNDEDFIKLVEGRKKIVANSLGKEAAEILMTTLDNIILLHGQLREEFNNLHKAHHNLCDAFEQLHNLTCPNCLNNSNKEENIH